jgi:acyl-coenzyme A synthetase/AMP-(fatty) acid ligase
MPLGHKTLRTAIAGSRASLFGRHHAISLTAMGRALDADLSGRNVLLRTSDQLLAALGLIELDGVAARIVITPPDIKPEHLPAIIERAGIEAVVSDDPSLAAPGVRFEQLHLPRPGEAVAPSCPSEWILFTSGTTGIPKMVAHSLEGLTGAIAPGGAGDIVWGTFYDIRRYGGLQILLRALLGQASLILSEAEESATDFLVRLGRHGVTHLTGTPSHWRRALMSRGHDAIDPRYVRLSGEVADQAILDSLKARFPGVPVGHAYASTEAGVGFEVTDGLEGFPASYVGRPGPVELRVVEGLLHVRSPRTARCYVGSSEALTDDGWVNSGDMVELRGDRYFFAGRVGGIINVGGLKINPEEVEAVINRHPGVRASRVSGRKNPFTGSVVVADVVLDTDVLGAANDDGNFKQAIMETCRQALPAHKVPAMLRFVPALELTAGGKLSRHG